MPNYIRITDGTLKVGRLQLGHGVVLMDGLTAPVSGTSGTGRGIANRGSWYLRTTGKIHVNIGTRTSPSWVTAFIAAASDSASTSPTASVSPTASPSGSKSPSASGSPSSSKSPSVSVSPSVSPSASGSPSASKSPSASASPS